MPQQDPQLAMLLADAAPKLAKVYPRLAQAAVSIITDLYHEEGLSYGVNMGLRSLELQAALYAQGRKPWATVNQMRKAVGLGAISETENQHIVTKLLIGEHNLGLAVDLVEDGDPNKAGIQWSWQHNVHYLKIGKYAKKYGVQWGGLWQSIVDTPHIELTGGLSVSYCYALYRTQKSLQAVWDAVERRLAKAQ